MMSDKIRKWFLRVLTGCVTVFLLFSNVTASAQTVPISEDDWALWDTTDKKVTFEGEIDCKSAILMEAQTGEVLFEKNADESLPPASVTKIMTLLLVMEAIEQGKIKWDDTVTASAHACSMGGSQIYLKEGERMSVEDMIKSVVIASANDAALALAEHIAGSEQSFVKMMNDKALQLDMINTKFENTNGLDDTTLNHYTSARDIAIMSRELIKHEKILEYSSIWMDTIRDGAFGLTNTNRLVRFYKGCNGLKTGSTSKAGFCVSATAERDGMTLICVIMGAENRDTRNSIATQLLDWGFSNYGLFSKPAGQLYDIPVKGGTQSKVNAEFGGFYCVMPKADIKKIQEQAEMAAPYFTAPIRIGDKLGKVIYTLDGKTIGSVSILSTQNIERIGFWGILSRMLAKFLLI
ncbi:MAG: D-alanyl-D-alanine carboxypeptidase [Clostridia bacterium]|nr:D-alanyl-D-alanine carboxypeptidase [Clostridia bacterium]